MRTFNRNSISAALLTVFRMVKNEQPIVWTKIEGLNSTSCVFFKEAVTHSFEKNGIPLKRLFIINDDGKTLHLNTSVNPDYRTSPELPDYVMEAMAFVSKIKREEAAARKASKEAADEQRPLPIDVPHLETQEVKSCIDLSTLSTEVLAAELFKRGWTITFGGIV